MVLQVPYLHSIELQMREMGSETQRLQFNMAILKCSRLVSTHLVQIFWEALQIACHPLPLFRH